MAKRPTRPDDTDFPDDLPEFAPEPDEAAAGGATEGGVVPDRDRWARRGVRRRRLAIEDASGKIVDRGEVRVIELQRATGSGDDATVEGALEWKDEDGMPRTALLGEGAVLAHDPRTGAVLAVSVAVPGGEETWWFDAAAEKRLREAQRSAA